MKKFTEFILIVVIFTASNAVAVEQVATPHSKSPATATSLALAGFLVPIGLMVMASSSEGEGSGNTGVFMIGLVGSIVGPGLGHAYAAESGRFWRGAGMRTLTWGVFLGAAAASWDSGGSGEGTFILVCTGAMYLVSSIYDIVKASDSVEQYNKKHFPDKVSLAPLWVPKTRAVGIGVSVDF